MPRRPALQRALEHKLYFDEAYDRLFYRPPWRSFTSCSAPSRMSGSCRSAASSPNLTLEGGRLTRRLQTGLLRTYVFFLGTGIAVLAIVFLLVR